MSGTRVGPVVVSNARAFHGKKCFYAATGSMPAVFLAGELRVVLRLTTIDDPQSAGYQVTLALQLATTDPNDPDSWADYISSGQVYVNATTREVMIRMNAPANATKFWIRLGVSASLSGGAAGDSATGDVTFILAGVSA